MSDIAKEKILLFWSGGKDSALALHYIINNPKYEIVSLITMFDREKNIVRFHGIPDSLIIDQAKMLGLPLQRIFLPANCTDQEYTEQVGKILAMFAKRGIKSVVFGDINQEENKKFRDEFLSNLDMFAIYPLWGKDTRTLCHEFFESSHKALVTSIMTDKLDNSFLTCEFNQAYIDRLPQGIDPAGELGEFHTFVTFSPHFKSRVQFSKAMAINDGPYLVSLIKEP